MNRWIVVLVAYALMALLFGGMTLYMAAVMSKGVV